MASTALDRYTRIHSTFPPPAEIGKQQERKGDVLDKIFTKSIPTVIVWDQDQAAKSVTPVSQVEEDDVWENMEHIDDADSAEAIGRTKRHRLP
jgi:ribosome biogenesis protein NSA1